MTPVIAGPILPFHFPTTTMFVDDHEEYLEVVPLLLDPMLHVRTYSSPRRALAALGTSASRPVPGGGWLYRWKDQPSRRQELVALDVDTIHRIAYDPERFAEVSVVVVDHVMPEMDGVAFCQRLDNPQIGKILLTGRADDAVAIEAFNAGIIDRFIRKNDPHAIQRLAAAIRELQHRYFERAGAFVAETLALGDFGFLRDPAFRRAFASMTADFQPTESYVHCNPTGLLLLDAMGRGRFLLVQTDEDLRAHYEIAEELGAPQGVLAALRDGEAVPWFGSKDGYYTPTLVDPEACLFPATAVKGDRWYYYSLIDRVERFQLHMVKPYRTWLQDQDTLGTRGDPSVTR